MQLLQELGSLEWVVNVKTLALGPPTVGVLGAQPRPLVEVLDETIDLPSLDQLAPAASDFRAFLRAQETASLGDVLLSTSGLEIECVVINDIPELVRLPLPNIGEVHILQAVREHHLEAVRVLAGSFELL